MTDEKEKVEEVKAVAVQDNSPKAIDMLAPDIMSDMLNRYRGLQNELDKAMPDQIMDIQGKKFRRKGYWRAVKMAFNLQVEEIKEEIVKGEKDWGYIVTYRATAPNGSFADGDGACMGSEKKGKMCTVHNVRAHAHTRAFNRAVSNLVGFGEVSADEIVKDEKFTEDNF